MALTARLTGPFQVNTAEGDDLTPRSSKERGLLLLLLTAPNGSRERAWLQNKLWSDRGKEQGAGSLRQAIYQCKKALGPFGGLLTSTKLGVSLDVDRFHISTEFDGEFAEGIDIRDPEFEGWLAQERANRAAAATAHLPPVRGVLLDGPEPKSTLSISTSHSGTLVSEWFVEILADQCAALLTQIIGADVVVQRSDAPIDSDFTLLLKAVEGQDNQTFVRARLSEAPFDVQVWSGHRAFAPRMDDPTLNMDAMQMVFAMVEQIRNRLHHKQTQNVGSPPALSARAIAHMFGMTRAGADAAEALLIQAHSDDPRAVHLGWKTMVRIIQVFEGYRPATAEIREEGRTLSALAMEQDPSNSMVLALVANSMVYLENRPEEAMSNALRATDLHPGNAFAWWTLAAVQLANHLPQKAYASAARSKWLFRGSTLEFLPESILGGAALLLGNEVKALAHFERSLQIRPTFKPSQRYALGLSAKHGRIARARVLAQRLSAEENDFAPERLVADQHYPTSLLRRDTLLDVQMLKKLES